MHSRASLLVCTPQCARRLHDDGINSDTFSLDGIVGTIELRQEDNGAFEDRDLPPGQYVLFVLAPDAAAPLSEASVSIAEGKTTEVVLQIP